MTFLELLVVMVVMSVAVTMFASMVVHTSRQRGINRENAVASNAARTAVELMRNEEFRDVFALYNADPGDDPDGDGTAPGKHFAVPGLTPLASDPDGMAGEIFFPAVFASARQKATWGTTTLDTTLIQLVDDVVGAVGGVVGGLLGGSDDGGLLGGGGGLLGGLLGGEEPEPEPEPETGSGGGTYLVLREDYVDPRFGMPRDLNGDSLIDDLDHATDYIVLPVHVQIRWRGSFGPRQHDVYTQIALFAKVGG